jgi:hypothetical protein
MEERLGGGRRNGIEVTERVQSWIVNNGYKPAGRLFSKDALQYKDNFKESWRYGRLFRTERGYLGISCKHILPGDKVCILWGGALPFILRQVGTATIPQSNQHGGRVVETFEFVGGDAYIHGIVDGEALKIAEQGNIAEREILHSLTTAKLRVNDCISFTTAGDIPDARFPAPASALFSLEGERLSGSS